jgi:hypothetical protein
MDFSVVRHAADLLVAHDLLVPAAGAEAPPRP